jgi:hypothetical protein
MCHDFEYVLAAGIGGWQREREGELSHTSIPLFYLQHEYLEVVCSPEVTFEGDLTLELVSKTPHSSSPSNLR